MSRDPFDLIFFNQELSQKERKKLKSLGLPNKVNDEIKVQNEPSNEFFSSVIKKPLTESHYTFSAIL